MLTMNSNKNTQEGRSYLALKEIFQAGHPLVFVCTPEEGRIQMFLQDIAGSKNQFQDGHVAIWN